MQPHHFSKHLRQIVAALLFVPVSYAAQLPEIINQEESALNRQAEIEKNIGALDDKSSELLRAYKSAIHETEVLENYEKELALLIDEQNSKIEELKYQLQEIKHYDRELLPLVREMLETLEQFVQRDLPFHHRDRLDYIQDVREKLSDPSLSIANKFQSVLSAYRQEHHYGYGLEVYQDMLVADGSENMQTVNYLRVGRLSLYYLSLDFKEAGKWDSAAKRWNKLDREQTYNVYQAVRIANKQTAPSLLTLPMSAPIKQ